MREENTGASRTNMGKRTSTNKSPVGQKIAPKSPDSRPNLRVRRSSNIIISSDSSRCTARGEWRRGTVGGGDSRALVHTWRHGSMRE